MDAFDNKSIRPREKQLDDLLKLQATFVLNKAVEFMNVAAIYKKEFPEEYAKSKQYISELLRFAAITQGDTAYGDALVEIMFGHDKDDSE